VLREDDHGDREVIFHGVTCRRVVSGRWPLNMKSLNAMAASRRFQAKLAASENAPCPPPPPNRKVTQIEEWSGNVSALIEEVDQLVVQLIVRIDPVCMPAAPTEPTPAGEQPEPTLAPIAHNMRLYCRQLAAIKARLVSAIDRMELPAD
jgi:hypothetical protein